MVLSRLSKLILYVILLEQKEYSSFAYHENY